MANERYMHGNSVSITQPITGELQYMAAARESMLRHQEENFRVIGFAPTVSKYGVATQRIIDKIQSDLRELLHEEDSDGYVFKPTEHAFQTAWSLISEACLQMGNSMLRPHISPDGSGGIRIEWSRNGRLVSVICPARSDQQGYIYHREGDDHTADRDTSPASLMYWLDWLIES